MASVTSGDTSWSHVTPNSDGNPDRVRTFVTLTNGARLLVPVGQEATIHDLHEAALRRAVRFGFQWNLAESYIQTTGNNPSVMDGEDKLLDVLDLTEENTFNLCSLVEGASTTLLSPPPSTQSTFGSGDDDLVYFRWITLEEALSQPRLSAINPEKLPISVNTPLSQLHKLAEDKVQTMSGFKPNSTFTLYLNDCKLAAKNNPASLRDLGLRGHSTSPLDIFIDIDSSSDQKTITSIGDSPNADELWGFYTTKRGICTLTTSLRILMKEIDTRKLSLTNCLDVLLQVTHFPPLLLALQTLHELGIESVLSVSSLRMLASALQIICLQMAPAWVCKSPEAALESSRQAVAWLFNLDADIKTAGWPTMNKAKITIKNPQAPLTFPLLPATHQVSISVASESGPDTKKDLVIALAEVDTTAAKRLGQSIKTSFSELWDFYLKYSDWSKIVVHKKTMTPQPTDFDLLLKTTALAGRFRMVGPLQLGGLLATQLPVVTLSTGGYVSMYDQEDYACGERRFYLWNAIQKKEIMKHSNPGQHLMQKLEPIIAARKKEQSWEVDSWTNLVQTAEFGTPEEAVVVCMDVSGSMGTSMPLGWTAASTSGALPSRLTEVKEFFKNFALRVSALRLPTYLGLVTFSSRTQVETNQELTPVHLNFEEQVEAITALSSTAMFNGLDKAREMLCALRKVHPKVKCRIILLTDGEDNASTLTSEYVGRDLFNHNIILDSVVIGTNQTLDLFKISKMTGGYAFAPGTQQSFFQIFLLETVVDLRTRPDIVKVRLQPTWAAFQPKAVDMPTPYSFPPCRPHPNQNDYFIALADADKFMSRQARAPGTGTMSVRSMSTRSTSTGVTGTTLSSGAGGAARVILGEIKEMINHPHEYIDVYVSESNMGFWKVAMQGPPGSAYANGTFLLYIDIGQDFPLKPPSARFMTPMLHPNITKHGRICHPIFDREWTGTTRVYQVLQHIWGILMSLEARDAVDPLSTLKFWTDPEQGRKEVEQYVIRFASRSRAATRADITGSDSSSTSSRISQHWDNASISSGTSNNDVKTITGSTSSKTASLRSATSRAGSHISAYLASQRAPPPLMSMPGQTTRSTSARQASAPATDADGNQLGRRASFFSKFKKQ